MLNKRKQKSCGEKHETEEAIKRQVCFPAVPVRDSKGFAGDPSAVGVAKPGPRGTTSDGEERALGRVPDRTRRRRNICDRCPDGQHAFLNSLCQGREGEREAPVEHDGSRRAGPGGTKLRRQLCERLD